MRKYLSLLCLTACTTVPGTGRTQFNIFPLSEDVRLGDVVWKNTLESEEILPESSPDHQRVDQIMQRLVTATQRRHPNLASSFDWDWRVIQDDSQINAWCLPGGKMAVYTGMINFVTSDDQLAAVMGHEIAHAVARHGTERLSQTQAAQVVLAASDGELNDREMRIAESAFGLGVALPFSRAHEHEADELGIYIAAAAGYDPRAAIDLWNAMEQQTGRTPEFLSTHPSPTTRAAKLTALLPTAERIRERNE
ncbi:MAG: peptidase [Phycisphaerae bacterium]|jgi:predicted Zn-dependent protease|nr:peptidase [Phycisphaerae bacterium]